MTRKPWFWIAGGVIIVTIIILGILGALGRLPWQTSALYEDPAGRFTMEIDPSWEQMETDGAYTAFRMPDPPMDFYVFDVETTAMHEAFAQALEELGMDPALLTDGDIGGLGDWELFATEDAGGLIVGLAGQVVGETAFVMVVRAREPGASPTNAATLRALTTAKFAGKVEVEIKSYADVEVSVRQQVDRLAGSVSVALRHNGEIVYTYVYGDADPVEGRPAEAETIYPWGSMTKIVTAVALMQLAEQERVDLDAWPGDYVPEFPERWDVTVRQLLTHAACFPDDERMTTGWTTLGDEPFPPLEEVFTAYVNDYPELACEPGSTAQYANPHYLALARIVEEVSGEPYEAYVTARILNPLEMDSASFRLVEEEARYAKLQLLATKTDPLIAVLNEYRGPGQESYVLHRGDPYDTLAHFRVLPPWGGLRSTPSDVTAFLQMHLDGGRHGNAQVLQPETVALMQEAQTSDDGTPLVMGLGWWHGEDDFGRYYEHGGGVIGGECLMRIYPELDLGVAVMGSVVGYRPEKIVHHLTAAWIEEGR